MDTTPRNETDLHEHDEYAWLGEQARALHEGRLDDLDNDNLAEFLDDMAASQRRELVSRLEVLITHWIKIKAQPKHHTVSWNLTINEQRNRLADLLEDSPSLRGYGETAIQKALPRAMDRAALEASISNVYLARQYGFWSSWTLDSFLTNQPPPPPKRAEGGGLDESPE